MAQSQFENSANQQAVPEGPRPITISDRDALHFPFAFSPAPADADSRIAFSRSVGVDSRARLDSLAGPFLSWRKARPIKPNATGWLRPSSSNGGIPNRTAGAAFGVLDDGQRFLFAF